MKNLNIKRLSLVALISWLLSLLYIFLMLTYYPAYYFNREIVFDHFLLYGLIVFGYGEVLIAYAVSILLIKYIPYVFIKRLTYYGLWIVIFSCVEFYFIILLLNLRSTSIIPLDMYFPPFFIKILFFIYYKYKEKQDCKKKLFENI